MYMWHVLGRTFTSIQHCHWFSGRSNIRGENVGTAETSKIDTQEDVSNSQILVFYSAQRHVIQHGFSVNRNRNGYFEVFHPVSKYRLKCIEPASCYHLNNLMINDHTTFYINTRIFVEIETFWELHWSMSTRLNKISPKHSILEKQFRFYDKLNQSRYWRWYSLDDLRIVVGFVRWVEFCLDQQRSVIHIILFFK
jgi:hypothetical protein